MIEEHGRSGQSQADFCRERGLDPTTFNGWLRGRIGQATGRKKANKPKVKFARVDVPVKTGPEVEMELPGGVLVRIRHGGKVGDLAELIRKVAASGKDTG